MTQGFDEWHKETDNLCPRRTYAAGAASRQAEIDAALKQRDSFIKAHHIAMDDVCKMKAERDALQKRIDKALKALNDASPTMLDRKAIRILKGEQK